MKTAEERKQSFANLDEKKLAKIDEMMQDAVASKVSLLAVHRLS